MSEKCREAFGLWFRTSKYTQVVYATSASEQAAWDAWQAAWAACREEAVRIVDRGEWDWNNKANKLAEDIRGL